VSRTLLAALLAAAGLLLMAGSASAHSRDRNHDRIPDRWEKRHHLSLHHNQARRDQDRDGLRNRAEFRAGLDPRDKDTDDDGIKDGDEHAGKVLSFENGVLKISVFGSDPLTGRVTDETEIECEDHGEAHSSSAGDDGPGDDGDDDHGDDEDEDEDEDCGTDALQPGAIVHEAELKLRSDGTAVFEEIELKPAA
jgi:hypothetical protein